MIDCEGAKGLILKPFRNKYVLIKMLTLSTI
jgi:hypothetical protein